MSAITNMVSLVRILANGRTVSVGNEIQLTGADQLVLAAANVDGNGGTFYGGITVEEYT